MGPCASKCTPSVVAALLMWPFCFLCGSVCRFSTSPGGRSRIHPSLYRPMSPVSFLFGCRVHLLAHRLARAKDCSLRCDMFVWHEHSLALSLLLWNNCGSCTIQRAGNACKQ